MDLTVIKDWTWLIITIGGVFVAIFAWGIRNAYTIKEDVRKVAEAGENNHEIVMNKMDEFDKRVSKVEKENTHTITILTDIKVQIAQLATTIDLFFKKNK
jgi:hypothetical protein